MTRFEKMREAGLAEMTNVPPVLYKYCTVDTAEKILRSGGVLLNSSSNFNDPFEMKMGAKWPEDDEVLRACIAELFPEEQRESVFQNARRRREKYPDTIPPNAEEMLKKTGISCFSEARDNDLMWGHYADKHEGICLGFRWPAIHSCLIKTGLESGIRVMKKVVYSDDFPMWGIAAPDAHKLDLLATKASRWAYEREWRIFAPDLAGQFQPLSKDALGYVIFGVKTSEENKDRIFNASYGTGYDPNFRQAKMVPNKYELEIVPCDWGK